MLPSQQRGPLPILLLIAVDSSTEAQPACALSIPTNQTPASFAVFSQDLIQLNEISFQPVFICSLE